MAELSTIARPYAEALFAAARSGGTAQDWLGSIEALAAVIRHPEVASVVADPKLTPERTVDLVLGLVKEPLPPALLNFLRLLVENGRLAVLPEVATQYRQLKNDADGVAECLIESAFPLSDAQISELAALLAKKFPLRLMPRVEIDASLIGGVRVTVGDQVLDASVRAQLDAMRTALTT